MESILSLSDAAMLNPLQLAYMGDAVWEMEVRGRILQKKLNVHRMHCECVRYVNANGQVRCLSLIRDSLTPEENSLVLRGRNAHANHPSPRNQTRADYSEATGFEALLGYLYLSGQKERMHELFGIIWKGTEQNG